MRRANKSAAIVPALFALAVVVPSLCSSARAQDTPVSLAPTPTAPPPAKPATPDQSGPQIVITLTSGEVLKGVVKAIETEAIVIQHLVLGDVRIPRVGISKSEPQIDQILSPPSVTAPMIVPQAVSAPTPTPTPAPEPKPAEPAATVPAAPKPAEPLNLPKVPPPLPTNPIEALFAEDEKDFIDGWKRSFEIGMNGTTGVNEAQNYRLYANFNRSTRKMVTTSTISYVYGKSSAGRTQDRAEATIRNDWALGNTPWTFWASGRAEFDSIQEVWDARVSAAAGLGYQIVKNEKTSLVGRLGIGGSREIGGENAILPEVGIFSLSFDYKIGKDASLYANTEYQPSGNNWDWNNFRAVSRAGVNFLVDPELKANLRLGVEHRHDSEAPTQRDNALDYFVTLGFAF